MKVKTMATGQRLGPPEDPKRNVSRGAIGFGLTLGFIITFGLSLSGRAADTVELRSGVKIQGKLLKETKRDVLFRSSGAEMRFRLPQIHKLTINGKTRIVTPKMPSSSVVGRSGSRPSGKTKPDSVGKSSRPSGKTYTSPQDKKGRSKNEVLAQIEKEGRSPPPWWNQVQLNYPKTLDMGWKKPQGGWNTRKNIGQYMWSVINENAGRFQEGTKFMHHVLKVNQNNPDARQKALDSLGHCYHDFHEDWARAAYWLQQAGKKNKVHLADCYWKLGNKAMAVETLRMVSYDSSRYGSAVKLWSDMDELDNALKLAESTARSGNAGAAYTAAGDACRQHGRFQQAIAFYRKVLGVTSGRKGILKRNKDRAQINIDTIKAYETLNLKRIPSGTYSDSSLAYGGQMTVQVTVRSGRIENVRITKHKDKQYYGALTATPALIIKKQGVKGVDTFSSATITSEAIIVATAKALAKAMR